jgi:hypothetical protein
MANMFLEVAGIIQRPAILVADAYYASRKIICPFLAAGHHLIAKAKINTVAFLQAAVVERRRRGRPKLYGDKLRLRDLFDEPAAFTSAPSPVYGERDVTLTYRSIDLLWRPVGRLVKFVLVNHPTRGRIILMCTFLSLDPMTIIRLYGIRFKIEVSFKQAVWTVGTYAYHFWMKMMEPIRRRSGNQHLHMRSNKYRKDVRRKMDAYHSYVALGCIAQGLLQHLAFNYHATVWSCFRSWLRTMKTHAVPSEQVVAVALRSSLPEFLLTRHNESQLTKFILDHAAPDRLPSFSISA